jgi:hypothetical protein
MIVNWHFFYYCYFKELSETVDAAEEHAVNTSAAV